jgi:hypothetical protein
MDTVLLSSIAVVLTIAVPASFLGAQSLLGRSQITLGVVSLSLFIFLTSGLYRGVRLEGPRKREMDLIIREYKARDKSGIRWIGSQHEEIFALIVVIAALFYFWFFYRG